MVDTAPQPTTETKPQMMRVGVAHTIMQLLIMGFFTYIHLWAWFFGVHVRPGLSTILIDYQTVISMHSISPLASLLIGGVWILFKRQTWRVHLYIVGAMMLLNALYVFIMMQVYPS